MERGGRPPKFKAVSAIRLSFLLTCKLHSTPNLNDPLENIDWYWTGIKSDCGNLGVDHELCWWRRVGLGTMELRYIEKERAIHPSIYRGKRNSTVALVSEAEAVKNSNVHHGRKLFNWPKEDVNTRWWAAREVEEATMFFNRKTFGEVASVVENMENHSNMRRGSEIILAINTLNWSKATPLFLLF